MISRRGYKIITAFYILYHLADDDLPVRNMLSDIVKTISIVVFDGAVFYLFSTNQEFCYICRKQSL